MNGHRIPIVQTSPYLTMLEPGSSSPVVYMTDTRKIEYPSMDAPAWATFGIVDLYRDVFWLRDRTYLSAMLSAAASPLSTDHLIREVGQAVVHDLIERRWLQAPVDLCREYNLISGEIEINANCNWGCAFCPVSVEPKPRNTMSLELFEVVISKLAEHGGIKYVTWHFFNEPTIDVHFNERVEILARYRIPVALYTNGSGLNEKKLDKLLGEGVLYHLIFNIPSLDENEFRQLTNSRTHRQSICNLERAIAKGAFPIDIVVNGAGQSATAHRQRLEQKYGCEGVHVGNSVLSDRAGALQGEYGQNLYAAGRLNGCNWPLNHFYVSWRGDVFICCNDYHQKEVYGNIQEGSIHEIMSSERAVTLRRKVFGVSDAEEDFICRRCHDQQPDFPFRQFRPIRSPSSSDLGM